MEKNVCVLAISGKQYLQVIIHLLSKSSVFLNKGLRKKRLITKYPT